MCTSRMVKEDNRILEHIRTENITDKDVLIKTVIVYVGKNIGFKAWGSNNKRVRTLVEKEVSNNR